MSESRRFTGIDTPSMQEWCAILHDDNPIHLDPAAAQALGFGPRTVNPGPANLAYLLTLLETAAPGTTPASLDAAFLGNVLAGDTAIATVDIEGQTARLELRVAEDDDGAEEAGPEDDGLGDDRGRTVLLAEVKLRMRNDDRSAADAG